MKNLKTEILHKQKFNFLVFLNYNNNLTCTEQKIIL